jgi:signal recognition particle GTPase
MEVNALIKQFQQMQRQMKKFAGMAGKNGGQIDPRELMRMLK